MNPGNGVVYTETVVWAAPEQFVSDAPYQMAIITLADGHRVTARMVPESEAPRVAIGDRVEFVEERSGIPFYRKAS